MKSIVAGHCGEALWLSVTGAGSKENSADVVKFVEPEIAMGKRSVVVDLSACTGLDSTFMGMLIGISKRLKQCVQGCLHIINASGRNAQLLRGLGVQHFCSLSEDAGPFRGEHPEGGVAAPQVSLENCREVEHQALTKGEQTAHCLKAHQDLCEISRDNRQKFQDVVELMDQKLRSLQP